MIQKILCSMFPLIGLGTFAYGVYELLKIKKCDKCLAMIIDYEIRESHDSDGYHRATYPIYEVEMPDGSKRVIRSNMSTNRKLGTCVNVYVSEEGKLYEVRSGIFMIVFGTVFIAVGLYVMKSMGIF